MGKESKKKKQIYVEPIYFIVHLKLTHHCKSTVLQ